MSFIVHPKCTCKLSAVIEWHSPYVRYHFLVLIGKPQELRVTDDSVELTWKREDCPDGNEDATHYVVQYGQGRGAETNVTVDVMMGMTQCYTASSLAPNTTYCFRVAVANSNGTGPFSDPLSITTLAEGMYSKGQVTTLLSVSTAYEQKCGCIDRGCSHDLHYV